MSWVRVLSVKEPRHGRYREQDEPSSHQGLGAPTAFPTSSAVSFVSIPVAETTHPRNGQEFGALLTCQLGKPCPSLSHGLGGRHRSDIRSLPVVGVIVSRRWASLEALTTVLLSKRRTARGDHGDGLADARIGRGQVVAWCAWRARARPWRYRPGSLICDCGVSAKRTRAPRTGPSMR